MKKKTDIKIKDMIELMFKNSDFVVLTKDIETVGMVEGDEGLIVGNQSIPFDENDIYNLRMHFIVHPISFDGHVDTSKMIMMDPKHLKLADTRRTQHLMEIFQIDFAVKDSDWEDKEGDVAEVVN